MNRTSLFLDEDTIKRIQKLARARGVSFATVVREALAQYVLEAEPAAGVPSIAGRFASGETDTSERVDELLWRSPHE
jgi:predicted transcriptional regulator